MTAVVEPESGEADEVDDAGTELVAIAEPYSAAVSLRKVFSNKEGLPAEGSGLLRILQALYWPVRDPATRAVYMVRRTTHELPAGGVLAEMESDEFQQQVLALYSQLTAGGVARESTLRAAMQTHAGAARLLPRPAGPRIGIADDGATWIDLGRPDEQSVRVTSDGWTVEPACGAFILRTAAIGEVPIPTRGGSLEDLWSLTSVAAIDQPLVRAWMVHSMMPPGTPCPILALLGEHGTAKTTSAQMIGESACDSPVRGSIPHTARDLMVTNAATWIVLLDNVSRFDNDTSDVLCRMITGDTYKARKLHSNGGYYSLRLQRPIITTAIDTGISRSDLDDRTITVNLLRMSPEQRRDERSVWADYRALRPGIIGALLDDLVYVLGAPRPQAVLPRMADYALTAARLDVQEGTDSLSRWADLALQRAAEKLASDPFWMALSSTIQATWEGSAAALLTAVDPNGFLAARHRGQWPSSPQAMTGWIRRGSPELRAAGWSVGQVPAKVEGRASRWRLVPPADQTSLDGAVDGHPLGCRCAPCRTATHPAGCHCDGCTAF